MGLFVLIWMHFSGLIQIRQQKLEFQIVSLKKKVENFILKYLIYAWMEGDKEQPIWKSCSISNLFLCAITVMY